MSREAFERAYIAHHMALAGRCETPEGMVEIRTGNTYGRARMQFDALNFKWKGWQMLAAEIAGVPQT